MAKNYDLEIQKNLDQIKKLTEVNKELIKKKRVAVQKERTRLSKMLFEIFEKHFGKVQDEKILEAFDLALEEKGENLKQVVHELAPEEKMGMGEEAKEERL